MFSLAFGFSTSFSVSGSTATAAATTIEHVARNIGAGRFDSAFCMTCCSGLATVHCYGGSAGSGFDSISRLASNSLFLIASAALLILFNKQAIYEN